MGVISLMSTKCFNIYSTML